MNKICLINDTHFGARNDNLSLLEYKKKFLDTVFFPYLDEHDITDICHLGDIVDRRKYININTASQIRKSFFEPIIKSGRNLHVIPGNHDVYFKNSNAVNVLEELLPSHEQVKYYLHPTELTFGKTKVILLPWVCEENQEECFEAIAKTKAQVLFGHLELQGFEMHRGQFCQHGQDVKVFEKFDLVASGHFHHKSTYHNINYLGNPFQMTWADYDDPKGFHTFDTDTRELQFISNPYKLFQKLHYNDDGKTFKEIMEIDFSKYKDTYVKVIVGTKTNPFLYDSFIQKLEEQSPIDVKAVDDHLNLSLEEDEDIITESESTIEILTKTIQQSGIAEEYKNELDILMRSLYNESSILGS